jgi:hypothetical protein
MISISSFSQEKKEIVYLFFDGKNNKTCKIEDGSGNLINIKKHQKKYRDNRAIFSICNEKFVFNYKKHKRDTLSIKSLKKFNIKNLDYLKAKYQKGRKFKHNTFEQINIIERISNNQIVKYSNVYWSGEWTIE